MFTAISFFIPVVTGNDPDAQAFIDVTGISGTDATAINNLVVELKANSLWNKMKVIYPMIGGTVDTCKYNLVDPQDTDAAYRITFTGSNTFNSNGVTFGGTTADYGNMHFIPSSSGISLNSGHMSYYNRVNQTTGGCYMGVRTNNAPANSSQIFVNSAAPISASFSGWCGPGLNNRGTLSNTKGYILVSRTTSTLDETYVNGTLELTYTGASTALAGLKMLIGARNFANSGITVTSPTDTNCAFASVGDGLSSSEVSTLYTIVQDYQTELSRQI
jgi:hypothetical protein